MVTQNEDVQTYAYSISAGGSIIESRFNFPKKAAIEADGDIQNVQLNLQNLSATDVTMVRAGRDIRYTDQFRSGASFTNGGGDIRIGGPGRLLVQAARDINLGTSAGIDARGNLSNLSLASSQSADLTVIAGYKDLASFAQYDAFFEALKKAGIGNDKTEAEQAIAGLFDASNTGRGDITMYFSQIKTQGDSGIDILTPGGNINAGLPTPGSADIGVVTFRGAASAPTCSAISASISRR